MRVSELLKQLTDHLAEHGDDDILVAAKPELESPAQAFAVEHAIEKDGEQLALLSVPPSALLLPSEDKKSANTCPDEEKEPKENRPNSLQQAIQSLRSENETLLSVLPEAIQRISEKLKETDPEKEATEEAESALEKFLKEITSSGPASIQIRVSL